MHLKHDVLFSDGTPLTAKTVISSLERYVSRESLDWSRLTAISRFEVKDDFTFDIVLKEPFALVLYYLATPRAGITRKVGSDLVGTGPWIKTAKMVHHEMIFTGNPHFKRSPLSCDTLKLVEVPFEESTKALERGSVNLIEYFTLGQSSDKPIKAIDQAKVHLVEFPTYDVTLILFSNGSRNSLSLPERKWVVNHLYNNRSLISGTNRRLACSPLPLGVKGCLPPPCHPDWWPYAAENTRKPKLVDLYIPNAFENRKDLIDRIGKILTSEGVHFHPHFVNIETLYSLHAKREVGAHLETFTIQIPDAFGILSMYQSQSSENFSRFKSSKFDELIERSSGIFSEDARLAAYQKAISILMDEAMLIPLVHETRYALVSNTIEHYRPSIVGPFYSTYEVISKQPSR